MSLGGARKLALYQLAGAGTADTSSGTPRTLAVIPKEINELVGIHWRTRLWHPRCPSPA
jgi:hypothetical protein